MTLEQMRATYEAQPFKPFVIHLADGRQIPVQWRKFLWAVPSGRTIVVWQPNDNMHIIDLLLVTDLEIKLGANGAGKRRKA